MSQKLTNNTDETTLAELFQAQVLLQVPYFQRPYKWRKEKVQKFAADIVKLADDGEDATMHFVGAIITQGGTANAVAARPYQVIDGQQRLTTIFLFIVGAARVLAENNRADDAAALLKSLALVQNQGQHVSNLKFQPSGQDRKAMNEVITNTLAKNSLGEKLSPFTFMPLQVGDAANHNNRVTSNFNVIRKFFNEEFEQNGGAERIMRLYEVMLGNMTLVQIDIKDALSGPKIYDSLNSAQEPMTVGELVKNDVFSRAVTLAPAQIDQLEISHWQPFYSKFGPVNNGLFDDYFFPLGLFKDPNVKKADVYSKLRQEWTERALTPQQIIVELAVIQDDFLDLALGTNSCGHPQLVQQAFADLYRLGVPTTMYPYLIRISHHLRNGDIELQEAVSLLRHTESFLVRRGAFGLEPSGLHAAFKNLWSEMQNEIASDPEGTMTLPEAMLKCINRRATVKWPNDAEFIESLTSRKLYGSRVTPYILTEYNTHLGGDEVNNAREIEHVLPQHPVDAWNSAIPKAEQKELVDLLGNLTLVSPEMNKEVRNDVYSAKKVEYVANSGFKMTRTLGESHTTWTSETIRARGVQLANWAVTRFPY